GNSTSPGAADTLDQETQALLAEADAQRRRQQYAEALATIARARTRAPSSTVVRDRQEELAMESLRNVRLGEAASFGDAITPGTSVIDAALATATGERRADLLAHTGWSTFL